jgi:SWI/SNF-related matrix-associated actin-dependent regulator of chromatin subfamily A3
LHTHKGALKWFVFHGQNQPAIKLLHRYDIVITTYHTLAAQWRQHQHNAGQSETLFSATWHRIILDEAHTIQNPQNQLSQACCAVRSLRRWAITGTPIQNKLSDFASIIKFLSVYPYSEQSKFDEAISKPWHQGDRQGFLRLKTLVRAVTISRTKNVINLPSRVNEVHHLDFSPPERWKYDTARQETKSLIEEAVSLGAPKGTTVNALQRLNILRLICSHGLLARHGQERRLELSKYGIPAFIL